MTDLPDFVTETVGDDPRLVMTSDDVYELYSKDRNEWIATFFPGYEDLPGAAKKVFYNPRGMTVKGGTAIPELRPWQYGRSKAVSVAEIRQGAKGSIDPIGKRMALVEKEYVRGRRKGETFHIIEFEAVPIDEYIAWADSLNYYENGGQTPWNGGVGLDPGVFAGGAYDVGHIHPKRRDRGFRSPIKSDAGTYFGPIRPALSSAYPFGANSLFFPNGATEPSYIGDQFATTDKVAISQAKAWL